MANTLLTDSIITKEALRCLVEELEFATTIDVQHSKEFGKTGAKIGNSMQIRKPVKYAVRTGGTYSAGDSTETYSTLTLDKQRGVDMTFSDSEMALDINDFSKQFIKPAVRSLASYIDEEAISLAYKDVYNLVGTAGTDPATALVVLQAGQKLTEYACPKQDRRILLNPAGQVSMINGVKALENPAALIGKQYKSGEMANSLGFKFAMSQNVPNHTVGLHDTGSTGIVKGASQTGATITTDGWAVSTAILKEGDIITFAGSYGVRNPTGAVAKTLSGLQQFVVTADVSSDGSGEADIPISPSVDVSGVDQTCSASPTDDGAITIVGTESTTYAQNLAYHPEAFTMGTAKLEIPKGHDFAHVETYKNISMRIVRQWDFSSGAFQCRLDVLFGLVTQRPEFACRIIGG